MNNTHMVNCIKLGENLPGLRRPPFPGELGEKIFQSISKPAWQQWLQRQTMFINEYRLNLTDEKAREFLQQQMQKFLFDGQDIKPDGYSE